MKNLIKKSLLISIALMAILTLNASSVLAMDLNTGFSGSMDTESGGFGGSFDPSSMLNSLMGNMGMNPTSMKDMFEQMNVSKNKKEVPIAPITFSPENPKEGEDVNANAAVEGFNNHRESLYYTWFIKHDAKCPEDDDPSDHSLCGYTDDNGTNPRRCHKGNCDWDNDEDVTLNDYKIEAIRLMAIKKFDSDFPDESYYTDALTDQGADNHDDDDDGYTAIFGGENSEQSDDSNDIPQVKMCFIHDFKSGKDYQLVDDDNFGFGESPLDPDNPVPSNCFHLFPEDRGGDMVGDGDYGRGRERLFGTDHHRADTLGLGQKDGASVTGLGLDKITWKYQRGDKAGVVVEGTSLIPNKYNNTSMQIMWTFPENEHCGIRDLTSSQTPDPDMPLPQDPLTSMVADKLMPYLATVDEDGIDNCLENSMKDVMAAGPQLLDVTLTPTPDSPMMEDTIRVTASISNSSNDSSQMKYVWTFSGKKEDGSDFTENDVTVIGPLTGNGLSSINFRINPTSIPDGNITVKVTISENYGSSGEIQRGKGSVDIPINSSGDRIRVYQVSVDGSSGLLSLGSEICNQGQELAVCPVLQNQIVGVRTENESGVSNFFWTLDGRSLNCASSMSSECSDGGQSNVNFFPIAGSSGQRYSLLLTANNVGGDGSNLNLTRNFRVVNPSVKIVADGTSAWPIYLGQYTPLNSQDCVDPNDPTNDLCADYSQSFFETGAGNSVTLNAEFTPQWIGDAAYAQNLGTEWTVDGAVSSSPTFTAGQAGDTHNIEINGTYTPTEDTRIALEKFGISGYISTEQSFSASVQVEVGDTNNATAMTSPRRLVASLLSNLPEQVFFLMRIVLSIFVILLVSNIVFIFSPSREVGD
jgi:hypothetical protein